MPLFVLFYSLYLISLGPKLIKNIYYPKLLKTELYGNRKKNEKSDNGNRPQRSAYGNKKRSKAHALDLSRFNDSGSTGIRTPDPLLVRQML